LTSLYDLYKKTWHKNDNKNTPTKQSENVRRQKYKSPPSLIIGKIADVLKHVFPIYSMYLITCGV